MPPCTRFVQLTRAGALRQKVRTLMIAAVVLLCICGFFAFVALQAIGSVRPAAGANGYRPSRSWHFAAGSTAWGMRTSLHILNPGDGEARSTIKYLLSGEGPVRKDVVVPARSGVLVDCMGHLGGRELTFGMSIDADRPVVVSREMYNLSPGFAASSIEQGMGAPSSEWYFAEGATSDTRRTIVFILNDGSSPAQVTVEELDNSGESNQTTIPLDPGRSYVLDAASVFPTSGDVSFALSSDEPIYAERYFETAYQGLRVGCCTPGSPGLRKSTDLIIPTDALLWRVEIVNPGSAGSSVELQYHLTTGTRKTKPFDVEGYSRKVVSFDDEVLGPGEDARGKVGLVTVSVVRGNDVAAESTSFGSSSECWVWASIGRESRRADDGPVYLPVVNNPCFRQNIIVANDQERTVNTTVAWVSASGKSHTERKTELKAGQCLSATSLRTNSPLAWNEVTIPNSENVEWSVVSSRAFNCLTADKASIAFASNRSTVIGANTTANKVALTFDVEGDPQAAKAILDQLKNIQAPATFFVLGEFAQSHPELVRRMAKEGHELGNLTYAHTSYLSSNSTIVSGLERTDAAVSKAAGVSTKPYMRLPYGSMSSSLLWAVNRAGYVSVSWNVDPMEWTSLPPEQVVSNTMGEMKPGSIILLYALSAQREEQELPMLIKAIRDSGMEIAPLSEVLFLGH